MNAKVQHGYNQDFYAWALHNAELIKQGKLAEVDLEHIAEEIESMGKSDKRELINRFAILLAHLLRWQYQPDRRSNNWKYTIEEQREEVLELLEDSPSLKYALEEKLERAYKKSLRVAATEIAMSKDDFPASCPFSLNEALNTNFFPN